MSTLEIFENVCSQYFKTDCRCKAVICSGIEFYKVILPRNNSIIARTLKELQEVGFYFVTFSHVEKDSYTLTFKYK